MGFRTPRLYRKKTGIYFVRVLFEPLLVGETPNGRTKREIRASLRTKDPGLACTLASWINSRLAQCANMTKRQDLWPDIRHSIAAWTLPGGITCNGDEDRRNLTQFLRDHPDIEQAIVKGLEIQSSSGQSAIAHVAVSAQCEQGEGAPHKSATSGAAPSAPLRWTPADEPGARRWAANMPPAPTRLNAAVHKFAERQQSTGVNCARTSRDKGYLFRELATFVARIEKEIGSDPFLHEITTRHLSDFIGEQAKRPAKARGKDSIKSRSTQDVANQSESRTNQKPQVSSPLTLAKKVGDLRSFFAYALGELGAVVEDPSLGLTALAKDYKKQGKKVSRHYAPFTDAHLKKIFEPSALLSHTRDPDLFWSPLLGALLGMRLGEIVTMRMDSIGLDVDTGIRYLDVTPEEAKNANSIRRLPITQGLIDLGFVDYIEHLRALGATHLFPSRNLNTPTALKDPSKVASGRFAKYLDFLGLDDPALVFHSNRHTVVSALQDGGASLADSMQICGHEAQDYAIRTMRMTAQQARSVHLKVYTHADAPRMNVEYPLARLKAELERCVRPPIDFARLRIAAAIVREHVVKRGTVFKSGWAPQRLAYTQLQVERIDDGVTR